MGFHALLHTLDISVQIETMMNNNNNILKILLRGLILREEFLSQKEVEKKQKGRGKLLEVMDKFMALILTMVSWV